MDAGTVLTPAEAAFVQRQRVARLATSDASGHPSVVPVCFAFDGARFYTPLDEKPKRVARRQLQRVRNIQARGEATLLLDAYDDDWLRLGYVLIHAHAALAEPGTPAHGAGVHLLRARYPQYLGMRLENLPLIALEPRRVTSWGPALAEEAAPASEAPWLQSGRGVDFLPLARGRRSVRAFTGRPVPRAALETMLEAARWAPSPHGRQPWRFAVLTQPERKAALANAMGAEWQRTLEMDGEPAEVIQLRLEKSQERIRTAPALILACLYLADLDVYPDADRQHAEEVMAIQSLGAAVQNMLLAAYAVGLDCGWMCAPLFCPDTVRAALGLDAALIPHALLAVGYAGADPKRRPHRPAGELTVLFD
jgi:PPOX class probable F420-dependent enzyme